MANELHWRHTATGDTLYCTIRSSARTYWNTAGTPALEALTVANWTDYDIALTETPAASYLYVGSWPAGLTTTGFYWVDVFKRAGGAPAIGDSLLGTLLGHWDGTSFEPWDSTALTSTGTALTGTTSVSTVAAIDGTDLTILRGDSLSASITGLGNIAARTRLYFTLKDRRSDLDTASIVQIEETDGLKYLNQAVGVGAQGDITVTDAVAGNITITLAAAATDDLTPRAGLYWDVQMVTAAGVTTLTSGAASITADVTRAVA